MIVRSAVSAVAACLTLLISGSQALASPIDSGLTYRVLNHPDGNIAPPVYALRLDGLDGSSDHNFTFDTESNGAFLTIAYDDAGGPVPSPSRAQSTAGTLRPMTTSALSSGISRSRISVSPILAIRLK